MNYRINDVTPTILERKETNMLKWSGHVVHLLDNRWPKRKMTWSAEGRRRRGRPEVNWGEKLSGSRRREI
jgi:hypothetical protein